MDTTFCSKCGVRLWDWVEICPDCGARQSDYDKGRRFCSICKRNEAIFFTSPLGNPDEPAFCDECNKK